MSSLLRRSTRVRSKQCWKSLAPASKRTKVSDPKRLAERQSAGVVQVPCPAADSDGVVQVPGVASHSMS